MKDSLYSELSKRYWEVFIEIDEKYILPNREDYYVSEEE